MNCEEYQSLIEEYLDGELKHAVADSVAKHIGDCDGCSRVARDLQSEQQLYGTYEPSIEVTPQLWSGIQARIGEQTTVARQSRLEWLKSMLAPAMSVPRVSGWATAALVLLAIGATAVFMKYTSEPQLVAPPPSVAIVTPAEPSPAPTFNATTPSTDTSKTSEGAPKRRQSGTPRNNGTAPRVQQAAAIKTPNQLVREAEQKYLAAIAMLSRDASRKRSQIDPATRARMDQAILSIDRTIAGTRQAVRQHPGDPVAVQYMLSAYARKVDLLRDIAAQ